MKVTVFLSFGGNEGNVSSTITQALSLLSLQPAISLIQSSEFYLTSPVNMTDINSCTHFINAVCSLQTEASAEEIFRITREIEIKLGKIPKPKTAPRPIDIDLLFYGELMLEKKFEGKSDVLLEIPHPRWKERLFVLVPLRDLTKEIVLNTSSGIEHYFIDDLIDAITQSETDQEISLVFHGEKSPLPVNSLHN